MKVANIMSRQVDSVSVNDTVNYASQLLFGRKITGLPVCEGKKIVGFISEQDILSNVFLNPEEFILDPAQNSHTAAIEEKVSRAFKIPVKEVMSKKVIAIKASAPLQEALKLMKQHNTPYLPVIDENSELIGSISNTDIFQCITREKLVISVDEEYNDWLTKNYYKTVDTENRLSHELPDLIALFKENDVKTILDIGCGTGDHVIALAKEGFHVTGIDRSNPMIEEAKKRMEHLPIKIKKRLSFICGDYNNISPEQISKPFDCVMIWGNTLSHNPYIYQQTLSEASELLSGPSLLLIQNTNFQKVLKTRNRLLNLTFVDKDSYEEPGDEHAFLEFYDKPDEEEMTILKTFAVFDKTDNKWSSYGVKNSIFAYITQIGLERLLMNLGFSDINFYGSTFDGKSWDYVFRKPFSPLESDWMNVIAKKK